VTPCIVDSAAIYIMVVKFRNTIWPPLPQLTLHRRSNSNRTRSYIAESTQNAVYIVRCLWGEPESWPYSNQLSGPNQSRHQLRFLHALLQLTNIFFLFLNIFCSLLLKIYDLSHYSTQNRVWPYWCCTHPGLESLWPSIDETLQLFQACSCQ
jgi:hypothetical protein